MMAKDTQSELNRKGDYRAGGHLDLMVLVCSSQAGRLAKDAQMKVGK